MACVSELFATILSIFGRITIGNLLENATCKRPRKILEKVSDVSSDTASEKQKGIAMTGKLTLTTA